MRDNARREGTRARACGCRARMHAVALGGGVVPIVKSAMVVKVWGKAVCTCGVGWV